MQHNTPGINDFLLSTLRELGSEFHKAGLPLILGGGFSLYLRSGFLKKNRSPRYPHLQNQRPTKDIDIFLTSDIIINPVKAENIKTILNRQGFTVKTEYFQFIKSTSIDGISKEIIVDLLSQPVSSEDLEKVVIKPPRIKPKGVEKFHAFFHPEAEIINFNLRSVSEYVSDETRADFTNIFLPSSMSFIVLKLFAFRDRIQDEKKDFGRHHAYDIFASILDMDEDDWKSAARQLQKQNDFKIIKEAKLLVGEYFSEQEQSGIIRIRENVIYRTNRALLDPVMPLFIADLRDMFQV